MPPEHIGVVADKLVIAGFKVIATVAVLFIGTSHPVKLIWLARKTVSAVIAVIVTVAFPAESKTTVWLAPLLIV